eukprot:Plantae.Rhodophyta-Purpureofilum_apyrenoidigerum.ctg14803.p1 GENE.Plantae.Rhodophyta-Purpureofilum_apyrenoidigerum.ctg14803~~Plantae.Rhodophyta-Purpureofilum_apyrenoidigerum.ctg14803.p1  ORF type:complete len:261 (-),score=49.30 Plantae.Rhodophyta-Purpureofilum_apyrenoidigerum.ctg14803:573-1355(-)
MKSASEELDALVSHVSTSNLDVAEKGFNLVGPAVALVVLVLMVLTVVLVLRRRSADAKGDTLVIVGRSAVGEEPAVGKTALFKQLKHGEQPPYGLVTSVQPNISTLVVEGKDLKAIDVPGMVPSMLRETLGQARAVVFVLDASRVDQQARSDAEFLYDVLTNDFVVRRRVPVLVFCNKADLYSASTVQAIRKELERELQLIRGAAVSTVEAVGESSGQKHFLGFEEEVFRFEHLDNISFGTGSASKGDVDEVKHFIARHF